MLAGDFEIESPLACKGRHRMAGQLGGRIAGLDYPEAPFGDNLDHPSLPQHADKRAIGIVHILGDEPCAIKAVVASHLRPFEAERTVHGTDALFAAIPHLYDALHRAIECRDLAELHPGLLAMMQKVSRLASTTDHVQRAEHVACGSPRLGRGGDQRIRGITTEVHTFN